LLLDIESREPFPKGKMYGGHVESENENQNSRCWQDINLNKYRQKVMILLKMLRQKSTMKMLLTFSSSGIPKEHENGR